MLFIFIIAICGQFSLLVKGARTDTLIVPSERYQSFQPTTVESLAARANLGANNSFRVESHEDMSTAKGVKLRRLVQTYGGYEVYGTVVTAEVTMGGHYTGHVIGDVVFDLSYDIPDPEVCQRSIDDVIAIAMKAEGLKDGDPRVQEKDGRRIAFLREDDYRGVMAYMVEFFVEELISRPFYVIDACDNTIYTTYNLIHNSTIHSSDRTIEKQACGKCNPHVPGYGGNKKTGRVTYNVAPKCLPVSRKSNTCSMYTRYVKVVNNMGSMTRSKTDSIQFPCSSGYRDPYGNRNGAYGVANDAMYFADITGRMYREKYRRYGLSWTPRAVIHYGSGYSNAIWSGRDMYFGDGGSYTYYPFVVIDIVAHEYAHGITFSNSRLEYKDQSGGINEAFSDISGTVVRYYESRKINWLFGKDVMKRRTAMRYMSNPPQDGRSIKHIKYYKKGMGVHSSSGIYNYAFYLMVTRYRLNIYSAYRLFLDANLNRWGRTTGFASGACHLARSAYANGISYRIVQNAFYHTGVSIVGCRLNVRSATIFSGQTRSEILVSADKNPILEMSLDKGRSTISVSSEDNSEIKLILARDEKAEDIVDEKANRLDIESTEEESIMYVKLKSSNTGDVKVVLKIS